MGASCGDLSIFKNQNLVGIHDGGETVCNDDQGFPLGQPVNGLLQFVLVLGVSEGCGLV